MSRILLVCALSLLGLSGCGGEEGDATTASESPTGTVRAPRPSKQKPAARLPEPSHCPPALAGCRSAEGPIVYVERVDPDGDGDAHFVIVDPQGITVSGLTFIDVRRGLRPHPLPGIGEVISAAGQVQTGSYGQSQIHAVELNLP